MGVLGVAHPSTACDGSEQGASGRRSELLRRGQREVRTTHASPAVAEGGRSGVKCCVARIIQGLSGGTGSGSRGGWWLKSEWSPPDRQVVLLEALVEGHPIREKTQRKLKLTDKLVGGWGRMTGVGRSDASPGLCRCSAGQFQRISSTADRRTPGTIWGWWYRESAVWCRACLCDRLQGKGVLAVG